MRVAGDFTGSPHSAGEVALMTHGLRYTIASLVSAPALWRTLTGSDPSWSVDDLTKAAWAGLPLRPSASRQAYM